MTPVALAVVAALGALLPSPVEPVPGPAVKDTAGIFVLGIDGMDPVILQRLMDEGQMPNFKQLAADGSFQELGTSNPPQSPVAWSNFVTGMNPGGHGIYDFVHRDPKTYMPISSATPPPSGEEVSTLDLFGLAIPLGGEETANNRSGTPFWDYLHGAGVEVEVYRMPGNFPPTPSEAMTLSGMGTDDMRALNGTYSWYTDELIIGADDLKAEVVQVTPEDEDEDGIKETIRTVLLGPPDLLHSEPKTPYLEETMVIHIDPVEDVALIEAGDAKVIIQEGEWSDWVEVSFDAMDLPMGMSAATGGLLTGIVRFYAKELRPTFKLYVSPVNFAASMPVTPITTPDDDAAIDLQSELGHFFTQGMPEETNALKDGLFDDDDYVKQVELVHEDGHAMLDLALRRFDAGDMTFMYLSDIDLQCHMLWHHGDPKTPEAPRHPAYDDEMAPRHKDDIEGYYRGVDAVLADVRRRLPDETLLVVMSDHGFQPYTRKVHLNAWLRDNGYLFLKDGAQTGSLTHGQIDWSKTKAYGLGFNAIYLNIEGREAEGIVPASQADALAAEITRKLGELTDPSTGRRVVLRADLSSDVYQGSRTAEAPDIVVGYDSGYSCSDKSTLGDVTETVFEDNTGNEFTGNHLMAPDVVPGILLVNRRLSGDGHDLTDVTASLLDYYGLPVPDDMVGQPFFN